MKKIRITCLLSIISLLLAAKISAQNIAIGEWRDHLSYQQTHSVAVVGEDVYAMTPYSMFIYNTEDKIMERFSKLDGLTGSAFRRMNYYAAKNCLLITYENSDIDLIKNNTIYNLPDIKLAAIIGDKSLNNSYFEDRFAYICCGFGIVVIDLEKMEIKETYRLGSNENNVSIYDLTADDSCFYAATSNGIYKALKTNELLSFHESWSLLPINEISHKHFSQIEIFAQHLVFAINEGNQQKIYQMPLYGNNATHLLSGVCNSISVADGSLMIATDNGLYVYRNELFNAPTHLSSCENNTIQAGGATCVEGTYWIADKELGLLKTSDLTHVEKIGKPNGPYTYNCFDLTALGNQVLMAAGYYSNNSWMYGSSHEGMSRFDGTRWTTYNTAAGNVPNNTHDICVTAIHPTNPNQFFAGTWGRGVYQFDNQQFTKKYDNTNSSLQPRSISPDQGVFISGLAFDSHGTLWVANSSCTNILSSLHPDGTWKSYNIGNATNEDIRKLWIDKNDQKWIINRRNKLIVFKESESGDHDFRIISVTNGEGGATEVQTIAFDHNGTLWMGTSDGIVLLNDPQKVLEKTGNSYPTVSFSYPKIEYGGYVRLLLSGEIVTAIVVNGNNDKWVSTKYSGLYKIGEYGTEELEHFTTDNSPLFSDNILSLCQDGNGELFIGTANGIISYRDVATDGKENNSEVYVFPNPVKPEYNGLIAITNLADRSYIKITDISGTLVYDCQAAGGQAVWNGKNLLGQRVKGGVYLVFIANHDGSQKEVTKIMVLD